MRGRGISPQHAGTVVLEERVPQSRPPRLLRLRHPQQAPLRRPFAQHDLHSPVAHTNHSLLTPCQLPTGGFRSNFQKVAALLVVGLDQAGHVGDVTDSLGSSETACDLHLQEHHVQDLFR